MAGEGYAQLGGARRSMIKRQKNVNKWTNIVDTIGTIGSYAAGAAGAAESAWGEYEKGYESLAGKAAPLGETRAGQKGWLKKTFSKPKGSIDIGNISYARKDIGKLGRFIGSDAGVLYGEGGIDKYKKMMMSGGTKIRGSYEPDTNKAMASIGTGGGGPFETEFQGMEEEYGESLYGPRSYAKGGSFVTNGPEMIMVGDNPGGREAVNVVPLRSDDRRPTKKRSLLESLYENNRNRRQY